MKITALLAVVLARLSPRGRRKIKGGMECQQQYVTGAAISNET